MQVRRMEREHLVKENILIVDDSEISREILVHMLEDEYTLYEAENGQQAVDILSDNYQVFQLVLLDLNMPVLDGYGVLEIMKKRGWLKELPVIIISEDPGDAYKMGATDFFSKPFDSDVVNARIHNILGLYGRYCTDSVTGGLNRKGFIRQAENFFHKREDITRYDVLFFDIKNFKAVNELTGIANGDYVLQSFYRDLVNAEVCPLITARIEADHFVCLAERTNEGYDFLNSLCDRKYEHNGKIIHIYAHCGIYHLEDRSMSVSGMIDRARLAEEFNSDEYVRAYSIYDDSMKNIYIDNAEISAGLSRGLENEEFRLYFQPIIDARTVRIAGAEALVRWQHPERGLISPAVFIPVLEKSGYISDLDLYAVRKVKDFLEKRFSENRLTVPVSVNLSRVDFYDEHMLKAIFAVLHSESIPKKMMSFEITETAYAAMEENCHSILKRLRASGARILLDDFGTGYSSFSMLQNYDFDFLKLDMEFIHQIGKNPKSEIILRSIIELSHQLDLMMVAEGVETSEQLEFLKENGCDYIQGYYYSRPVDAQTFAAMLDLQEEKKAKFPVAADKILQNTIEE